MLLALVLRMQHLARFFHYSDTANLRPFPYPVPVKEALRLLLKERYSIHLHRRHRLQLRTAMGSMNTTTTDRTPKRILHICNREMLRPLRDEILRVYGFEVDSCLQATEGVSLFQAGSYDLVLVDVEGESAISSAEGLCSAIKTAQPQQLVAFVCNWRVALQTDCPDEILRTEFDPQRFVDGVKDLLQSEN